MCLPEAYSKKRQRLNPMRRFWVLTVSSALFKTLSIQQLQENLMKTMEKLSVLHRRAILAASLGLLPVVGSVAVAQEDAFLPRAINSSTIPANGDLNPYGVAFVPSGFPSGGKIASGDVLVSNFNNSANLQGIGTSIVQLNPSGPIAAPGSAATFFTSELPGLSTALGALRGGFVIVGNVPTKDGTFATISRGALQVIDRHGKLI